MQVEIVKWGNSSAIRLPSMVLKSINVELGDRLNLKSDNGSLVLEPVAKAYQLDDMLARITTENRHDAVILSVGNAPVGREVW